MEYIVYGGWYAQTPGVIVAEAIVGLSRSRSADAADNQLRTMALYMIHAARGVGDPGFTIAVWKSVRDVHEDAPEWNHKSLRDHGTLIKSGILKTLR